MELAYEVVYLYENRVVTSIGLTVTAMRRLVQDEKALILTVTLLMP